jgi:hypothetical protein
MKISAIALAMRIPLRLRQNTTAIRVIVVTLIALPRNIPHTMREKTLINHAGDAGKDQGKMNDPAGSAMVVKDFNFDDRRTAPTHLPSNWSSFLV